MANNEDEPNPLTVTFPTAKKISGLGFTTLWKLGKEHRIELVRVGGRTLITFRSLAALLTPPKPGTTAATSGRPRKTEQHSATAQCLTAPTPPPRRRG